MAGRLRVSLGIHAKGIGHESTDVLKKDHDTVKKMFAAFEKKWPTRLGRMPSQAEEICEELLTQAAVEEEIFDPAVKSVRDKQAFDVGEALQDHKQIKAAMADIRKAEGQEACLPS
jgi:deoxyribodipyrimidine photolyase